MESMENVSAKIENREGLSKFLKEVVKFIPKTKIRDGEEMAILKFTQSNNPEKEGTVRLINLANGGVIMSTALDVAEVNGDENMIIDSTYLTETLSNMYENELVMKAEGDEIKLVGKRNNYSIPMYKKDDSKLKAPIKRHINIADDIKEDTKDCLVIKVRKSDFIEKLSASTVFAFGGVDRESYVLLTIGEEKISILGKGTAIVGKATIDIKEKLRAGNVDSAIKLTKEVSEILMAVLPKVKREDLYIFVGKEKLILQIGSNTIIIPKIEYSGSVNKLEELFKRETNSAFAVSPEEIKDICSFVSFSEKKKNPDFKKDIYKIKISVDPKTKRIVTKGENWVNCRRIGLDADKVNMELALTKFEDTMGVFPKGSKGDSSMLSMSIVSTENGKQVHFKNMIEPEKDEDKKDIKKWIDNNLIIILAANEIDEADVCK